MTREVGREIADIPVMRGLTDAQRMHREHPDTFYAPSREELALIKPGDFVKVCWRHERFWVEVEGGLDKYLIGTVANEWLVSGFAFGALYRFERRRVYSIMHPPAPVPWSERDESSWDLATARRANRTDARH